MTEYEIFTEFAAILEEFTGTPVGDVQPDSDLVNDLDVDSLTMVEIINVAEEKFSIEIPDEDVRDLGTVQNVVNYVQRVQRSGTKVQS